MSRGHVQHISHFARRALGRCRSKGIDDNVDIIDVDRGKTNVVLIEDSESPYEGLKSSKEKGSTSQIDAVIHIDDEDRDADEIHGNECHKSTSKTSRIVNGSPTFLEQSHKIPTSLGMENHSPKLDANSGVRPEYVSSGNRYGLDLSSSTFTSDSDSPEISTSESDSSDCEIIEDSSGSIRHLWERAYAYRTKMSQRVRLGSKDQASASGSTADSGFTLHDSPKDIYDVENCRESSYKSFSARLEEVAGECEPSSSSNSRSSFFKAANWSEPTDDSHFCGNGKTCAVNSDPSIGVNNETGFRKNNQPNQEQCPFAARFTDFSYYNHDNTCFRNTEIQDDSYSRNEVLSRLEEAEQVPLETLLSRSEFRCQTNFQHAEEPCPSNGSDACDGNSFFCCNNHPSDEKKDGLQEQPLYDTPSSHDFAVDHTAQTKEISCKGQIHRQSDQSLDELKNIQGIDCAYNEEAFFVERTCDPSKGDGANERNCSSGIKAGDSPEAHNDLMGHIGDGDMPHFQNTYTGDREKHKESDEYKHAEEEEWASRQQQLKIQSEEAQRLRKRRKAEKLRLLDMQNRQKQRLEEIRESQKKDEDIINVKEKIRTEVRKELDKMERRFKDMASLLRGLGIHVGGGPFPLTREVNAAYKQALLRFHPDRASRIDIRQQVEAEETFKMISRLKEKLLPVA